MSTFTVHFTKVILEGILKGISIKDSISFPSRDDALKWLSAMKCQIRKGEADFYFSEYIIQEA